MEIQEAKQKIWEAGKRLLAEGLVKGTWGNISLRVGRETVVITPSGREYQDLKPEEMVEVNLLTSEIKGKPGSTVLDQLHQCMILFGALLFFLFRQPRRPY